MQLGAPVSPDAFAARLDASKLENCFGLAVSGGRDSMALVRLCADWAAKHDARAVALIVDHGLRDGSETEAARVKSWCEAAGLEAIILTWEGQKPSSGIQAAARAARYRLLAAAANRQGLAAILTAHSADDRAETFLMRLSRGAGPAGLASVKEEISIAAGAGAPVRLLRPLLSFTRKQLTATAERFGQDYLDDPSNDDLRFERVRARRLLQELSHAGFADADALMKTADRMAAAADALRRSEDQEFRALGGVFTGWGGASLALTQVARKDGVSPSLVARLVRAVSAANYAPDETAAADALATAMRAGAATLSGAMIRKQNEMLWFMREPAALLGRAGVNPATSIELAPGGKILWDRRFVISASAADIAVQPLGENGLRSPGSAALRAFKAPREGLMSAPGLYRRGRLIGVPGVLFGQDGGWSAACLSAERFAGRIVRF